MARHSNTLAVAAAALALGLLGCSGPDASGSGAEDTGETQRIQARVTPGTPDGWEIPVREIPMVGWIEEGVTFGIVTWGSSSCLPVAEKLEVQASDRIRVVFAESAQEICTADMAPATHEITLPSSVTGRPIALELVFEHGANGDEPGQTMMLGLD